MKRSLIMLTLLIIVLGAVVTTTVLACRETTCISVLLDVTDKASPIAGDNLMELAHLKDHPWSSCTVRITTLSNYDYNHTQQLLLDKKYIVFGNPQKRYKEMDRYRDSIETLIQRYTSNNSPRDQSVLCEPIVREANRLAASFGKNKYLIIQSDLAENSNIFSVYTKHDLRLAEVEPKTVEVLLLNNLHLQSLAGIQVYLVHQPISESDNKRFTTMAKWYQRLFERAGATVEISSNLTN